MKRHAAAMLVLCMLLSLCACAREAPAAAAGPGKFTGIQVRVYGGDWQPMDEVYSGQTYLELDADGEGVFCVDGEAAAIHWEETGGALTLTMGSKRCTGTMAGNDVTLRFFDADIYMRFSKSDLFAALPQQEQPESDKSAELPAPASDYAAYWSGSWYGWHIITDTSESLRYLKDNAWDACARITVRGKTGRLIVWDTETEPGELLCEASVAFSPGATDAGCMTAEDGVYLGCDMTDGWVCDPGASEVRQFAHMICIVGRAEDENGEWVRYRLYLRPWGMDWEDVRTGDTSGCTYRNMLPPDYDSWYAPLLARGITEMPDSFEPEE